MRGIPTRTEPFRSLRKRIAAGRFSSPRRRSAETWRLPSANSRSKKQQVAARFANVRVSSEVSCSLFPCLCFFEPWLTPSKLFGGSLKKKGLGSLGSTRAESFASKLHCQRYNLNQPLSPYRFTDFFGLSGRPWTSLVPKLKSPGPKYRGPKYRGRSWSQIRNGLTYLCSSPYPM